MPAPLATGGSLRLQKAGVDVGIKQIQLEQACPWPCFLLLTED
jgi:hypothetical protein